MPPATHEDAKPSGSSKDNLASLEQDPEGQEASVAPEDQGLSMFSLLRVYTADLGAHSHAVLFTAEPNRGNGADLKNYSWVQTLSDATVSVPVPSGTKGKMCDVVITKGKIKVTNIVAGNSIARLYCVLS